METIPTKYKGYFVKSDGTIIGKRGRPMIPNVDRNGYETVILRVDGKALNKQVHRVILETLLPVDNHEELFVNHINGDKTDNRLENLEWCTKSQNTIHSFYNGLQTKATNQYGTYKVIDKHDVLKIEELMEQGLSTKEISKRLGYTQKTIRKYKGRIKDGFYKEVDNGINIR